MKGDSDVFDTPFSAVGTCTNAVVIGVVGEKSERGTPNVDKGQMTAASVVPVMLTLAMRMSRTIMSVLTATAIASGCGTTSANPTPAEIGEGLLTVTDLDTDWRETQRDAFDERGVENPVLDVGSFCPDAAVDGADIEDLAGRSGADVEFQKKDGSAAIRLQAWSNADAVMFDDTVAAAAIACDGESWTDEFGTAGTFAVVDGPELGDSSVHWATTLIPSGNKGDKATSAGRTSVVRFDDVVMVLQWGAFGGESVAEVDETWWSELVGEAYEKLDDAL